MASFARALIACLIAGASSISLAGPAVSDRAQAREQKQLAQAVARQAGKPRAAMLERKALLPGVPIARVKLSPDGRAIAYLRRHDRAFELWLLDTRALTSRRLLTSSDASDVVWSRDGQWLFLPEAWYQLYALRVDGGEGSGVIGSLGGAERREFIAADPLRPAAALLSEQIVDATTGVSTFRLLRVDTRGQRQMLHESSYAITGFAFDRAGRLAFIARVEDEHLAIRQLDAEGKAREVLRCERLHRCDLLPVTDAQGRALLDSDMASDRARLSRLNADGRLQTIDAAADEPGDLSDFVLDPRDASPLIASYRAVAPNDRALSATVEPHLAALRRRFPARDLRVQPGVGEDAPWLIEERAASLREPRWYLYDPASARVTRVLDEPSRYRDQAPLAALDDTALVDKIAFHYPASDGMRLQGFLTVPAGVDARRAPLVVQVHGGPWNAARPDYDPLTQLLANRGYVVFEPNFRGSMGLGRDYVMAARGDFGNGRVQRDIDEGTRYLLARGIGDARRVAIVGASFGGYSVLLGMTHAPELYRVGAAAVPPSDFSTELKLAARNAAGAGLNGVLPFTTQMRFLDLDVNDQALLTRLHAQSPLANTARVRGPVLLVAGANDRRVAVSGVIEYASRLRQAKADVRLLIDPQGGHGLSDDGREAWLYLVEDLLHEQLAGPEPAPVPPTLGEFIARNIKFSSASED